jgi:hypothetical protein
MTARRTSAQAAKETKVDETPAVVDETPAPVADTADAGQNDLDVVEEIDLDDKADQGEPHVEDTRAEALAKLIAGGGADDETSGGEVAKDATPLPDTNGVVREWGGDLPHLVLFEAYSAIVNGNHVTATTGDVVRVDEATAARGLSLGAIRPLA